MNMKTIIKKMLFAIWLLTVICICYYFYIVEIYKFDIVSANKKLPKYAQTAIAEWSIESGSEDVMNSLYAASDHEALNGNIVLGLTVPTDHKIYLSKKGYYAQIAYIHEIGHVVDFNNNYPSSSEEFKRIYLKEKDDYISSNFCVSKEYITSNEAEFFAEIFKNICENDDKSLKSVPESVRFVRKYCK